MSEDSSERDVVLSLGGTCRLWSWTDSCACGLESRAANSSFKTGLVPSVLSSPGRFAFGFWYCRRMKEDSRFDVSSSEALMRAVRAGGLPSSIDKGRGLSTSFCALLLDGE